MQALGKKIGKDLRIKIGRRKMRYPALETEVSRVFFLSNSLMKYIIYV